MLPTLSKRKSQKPEHQTKTSKDAYVSVLRAKRVDHFSVIIEDNGPGIPSEIREDILQPFFTTKDVGKGPASECQLL